jgi:uncharacterized protein YcbX
MPLPAGQSVGRVTGLWRYPVKSMAGEVLASVEAGELGFVGDRAFGVVEVATGHLLSAKRVPDLLTARATYGDDGEATIALPTGRFLRSDDADVNDVLSAWLGRAVFLDRPSAGQLATIEMEVDLDDPSKVFAFMTRPGLFFDGAVMHLLSDASLAAARVLHPTGAWIPDRFRPNVLIESAHGPDSGFVDDHWVGASLDVSGMRVDVVKRCDRCVLTTRAMAGTPADKEILRTLARHHGGDLGVKGQVSGVGRVLVGDDVLVSS